MEPSALSEPDDCTITPAVGGRKSPEPEYLTDLSPRDKPWDERRAEADVIQIMFARGTTRQHERYAERIGGCAQFLEFAARDPPTNGRRLSLKTAWFCHLRNCPVCMWRRALQWQARLYQALPRLLTDFPTARFIFATFTVRNCRVENLRYTLGVLSQGWKRLIELRVWPALGWIRAVEITRSKDGTAHPHYHCLLMVPETYFAADYLKQREWAELWRQCLRLTYTPIVDVRVIRQGKKRSWLKVNRVNIPQMWAIITEILKYSVKPSDMLRDHRWFLTLVEQVRGTRAVAVGGVLKRYLRAEIGRQDLTQEPGEDPAVEEARRLFFGWKQPVKRYRRIPRY
jgi:plasmid rolling circle replication initiator protein Rep